MAKMKGRLFDRNRLAKRYPYVRAPKRHAYLGDKNLEMEALRVTFNNESSKVITFEFPFIDTDYTVALSPRQTADSSADSAAVNLFVETASLGPNGFTIGATSPFTGEVDVMVVRIS